MDKMITMDEYTKLALRTIKPHVSKEMAIADWALGLGGELSEVVDLIQQESNDKMEMAKELGDILWYSVALAAELGLKFPSSIFKSCMDFYGDRSHCATCMIDQNPKQTTIMQLVVNIGTIQERIKHTIMHKEDVKYQVVEGQLHGIIEKLTQLAVLHEFTIYDVAQLNAGKLAHRYNMKSGVAFDFKASADRHTAEIKFEDTATYKRLYGDITGKVVAIGPDDIEVL